jgi:biopolymer transport protein ExbD
VILIWTLFIALTWTAIATFSFFSVPRSKVRTRVFIGTAAALTFVLICVVGLGIQQFVTITKQLNQGLPGSGFSSQPENPDEDATIVHIHEGDFITLAGVTTPLSDLGPALKARISADPHLRVVLKSDPNGSYKTAKAVLDICEQVAIKDVIFEIAE